MAKPVVVETPSPEERGALASTFQAPEAVDTDDDLSGREEPRDYGPCKGQVSVVIRGPDGEVVLVRKQGSTDWGLPTGKVRPDETFDDAARREAWEETGLRVRPARLLRHGTMTTEFRTWRNVRYYAVFLANSERATPEPRDRDEIQEARWMEPESVGPRLKSLLASLG